MSLQNILKNYSKDIEEVNQWSESQYQEYFSPYFKGTVELYHRLKSSDDPISDTELEYILTDLPLELFAVSEQLSKLKTVQEVIKMSVKKKEREYIKTHIEGSETKRKEAASAETEEDRFLVVIYDGIAERVAKQMAFCKELIMSAKKIWDARRADGTLMPEVNNDKEAELPVYDMSSYVNKDK